MTNTTPPAVWVDGDPLMEAIAAAVWEQCRTDYPSCVVDDPRNIAAVAATVARATAPAADRSALRDRIAEAIADTLKPRYGGPQHNTPGGLPLTATPEEVRLHRAQPLADAVLAALPASVDRSALKQAHVALAAQAGRDQAALARVRRLHDALDAETSLTSPDDEITRGAAARKIAAALDGWTPPPATTDRAALLREAADECDTAGAAYTARAQNEHAAGAFTLMETFLRKANEAEYIATPCDFVACEPGGEPCSTHERLMAHAEGDHELCAPDCGTPTVQTLDPEIVAYRDPNNSRTLLCREHGPRYIGLVPVTSDELPDGGICTFGGLSSLACGVDVLIPQQPKGV